MFEWRQMNNMLPDMVPYRMLLDISVSQKKLNGTKKIQQTFYLRIECIFCNFIGV
jgi:hypothetical protein